MTLRESGQALLFALFAFASIAPAHSAPKDEGFIYIDPMEPTKFKHYGKDFYFQGTNFYRIGIAERHSENDVYNHIKSIADKGMKVLRIWGFSCNGGFGGPQPMIFSINGNGDFSYNDNAMRRLDIALDAAAKANLKVILPFVNFEHEYCGMEWWVKQITGSDDKHRFFFDNKVKSAYKKHLNTMLNRTNSINGRQYKNDPTIMAIELANEPHTKDNYEKNQGKQAGEMVYYWLKEMSDYVRSIDSKHLIASGEEGYKTSPSNGTEGSKHQWISNGLKGVDFARNITLPNINFATVHIYPDNWKIPMSDMEWVKEHIVKDRANIAHGAGKPIIMEESGFSTASRFSQMGYQKSRRYSMEQMHKYTNEAGYAGTMVWQAVPAGSEAGLYTFDFNSDVFNAIYKQIQDMNNRSAATYPACEQENSDPDGDGWGWENNTTCVQHPSCLRADTDPDGDGWGWENDKTCKVRFPTCQSAASDPDYDGWGWENNQSCKVRFTTCQSASSDPDGDGWGWENNQSCQVAGRVAMAGLRPRPQTDEDSIPLNPVNGDGTDNSIDESAGASDALSVSGGSMTGALGWIMMLSLVLFGQRRARQK